MRVREANTRILRAKLQPYIDAMLSNLSLPCATSTDPPYRGESNSVQDAGVRKTSRQRRVGRAFLTVVQRKLRPRISAQNGMHFPDGLLAESASRNPRSGWDALSRWRPGRKVHPGIRAQNGTRFPSGGPSGKFIPESRLKLGHTFRFTCRLEKPVRSHHPKTG